MGTATNHAKKRLRERLGVTKGSAISVSAKARRNGIKITETKDELREWLEQDKYQAKYEMIRIYSGNLFIFALSGGLITVYPLPDELIAIFIRCLTLDGLKKYINDLNNRPKLSNKQFDSLQEAEQVLTMLLTNCSQESAEESDGNSETVKSQAEIEMAYKAKIEKRGEELRKGLNRIAMKNGIDFEAQHVALSTAAAGRVYFTGNPLEEGFVILKTWCERQNAKLRFVHATEKNGVLMVPSSDKSLRARHQQSQELRMRETKLKKEYNTAHPKAPIRGVRLRSQSDGKVYFGKEPTKAEKSAALKWFNAHGIHPEILTGKPITIQEWCQITGQMDTTAGCTIKVPLAEIIS